MYVCKESIEHVLLLHGHGPDEGGHGEHGAAHGTMGHGEAISVAHNSSLDFDGGIVIPTTLLLLSVAGCVFTAVFLKNHLLLSECQYPVRSNRM